MSVQVQQELVSTPSEGAAAPVTPETQSPAAAPAAPAESTPAPEPGAEPPKEGEASTEGAVVPPPAFSPKEKFKAWRAEHDVPKWVRDLVKDSETETKAIELLEKATGLDLMKPKFEETKVERDNLRQEHQGMLSQVQDLRETYQRGDIDLWLQKLGIPNERMLQWALDKVNYSQLPPEQQRILDQKTEAERKAVLLEKQAGTYEQQVYEQQRQTKAMFLDSGLARPDVQTFAEAFDAKAGRPGAFRQEVISTGEAEFIRSQGRTDLTPDQAISAVLDKYKNFISPAAPQAQPGQVTAAGPRVVVQNPGAAAIPNIAGKPASPMKTSPTSIDDLRKLAKDMQARG